MKAAIPSPSPALLAANRRLHQLREQIRAKRPLPTRCQTPNGESPPWELADVSAITAVSLPATLPPHMGWDSTAVTRAILRAARVPEEFPAQLDQAVKIKVPTPKEAVPFHPPALDPARDTVRHYPSLGIAALKAEQATTFRVWLMCRYLDQKGQGWLDVQQIRQRLTGKESKLRLFCWRRLRQILEKGRGRFWQWDKENGRLWLFGALRVAINLNLGRLTGKPVLLPVASITAGIGTFKAHLYAAWHSGRKSSNPISRTALEQITSVPERTQRHYCRVAGIRSRTNITIGDRYTPAEMQEQAWRNGRGAFQFTDHHGKQGRQGDSYVAWQLPNSYIGPHQRTTSGKMRKINRKLTDLVTKGAQGNGGGKVDRMYFANGMTAVQTMNRSCSKEAFWPIMTTSRKGSIWAVISW